ncbi:Clan CA, family C19, ubiquitin hydrolase-like cysteine peptidase [Tritrichomonas foetus]|uniref:ubiquitinyl hydrolase 1 n=1 Tax=Tritrichomonas foetus TaxID=1144522 RepID=A0A1J4KWF8_9EUKA|nr:Clan CA, family C19, ubiquitin hydrolase-like cysteine peptidase [Tritrichomonas foetus]|eukprot:OHT15567.1 Clan CA, family C19, ubiquitin hydrolase-like cysteine peptidase [Tritrichomonas foetus]
MGKGAKNAKARQQAAKNSRKSGNRGNQRNQQKNKSGPSKSGKSYVQSCQHFKFINEDAVRKIFDSREFSKAISGKSLTRLEKNRLQNIHPEVSWYHPEDLYICLVCGKAVDGKHYDSHFDKGNHCLSLSLDEQSITCTKCHDEIGIEPGTLCAELLGIEKCITPLTAASTSVSKGEDLRGLVNLGNSCWMNSVLQMLVHLPVFTKGEATLTTAFNNLRSSLFEKGKAIRPSEFVRAFKTKIDFLDVTDQQDAYEFLVLLLDCLRDEQGGSSKGLNSNDVDVVKQCLNTPLDDLFGFILKTEMKCEKCCQIQTLFERAAVLTLFVPFAGGATTLIDCIKLFFSDSSPDDERECEFCKEKADCIMTPSLLSEHMPNILVLHLSRFRMGKNGFVKNNVKVDFPELLDFNEIMPGGSNHATYKLFGYVTHYGSIDSGHYTSIGNINDQYYLFDDDTVSPVDKEKGLQLQPYIMFYIKNEENV